VFVISRAVALLGVLACLALAGCGKSASSSGEDEQSVASVEPIKGSDLKSITLTPVGADRIGIRTAPVRTGPRKLAAIPYSAVMYDPDGKAFTYESPKRLVFVRHPITIDHLTAKVAYLRSGPAAGRPVVTVGGAELLGNEEGVQED
jgi:hypothetical protein